MVPKLKKLTSKLRFFATAAKIGLDTIMVVSPCSSLSPLTPIPKFFRSLNVLLFPLDSRSLSEVLELYCGCV